METSQPEADETLPSIDILYEEGPCLVISKPGGVLTQAPPGIDSMERRIKQFVKIRDHKPGNVYLGVPHRLDRPASGVMVFARHVRAARRIAEQFEGRLVRKVYWAVVAGAPDTPEGRWRDFMRKTPNVARSELVEESSPDAKEAILEYRTLESVEGLTCLQIELVTGRTHQIRLQAGTRKLPLLGDSLYGSNRSFGPQTPIERDRWIALHARRLEFEHPMTRKPVAVEAPLPPPWRDLPFRTLEADYA